MKLIESVLHGHEATKIVRYADLPKDFPGMVAFDDLPNISRPGVLKMCRYVGGKLTQVYSQNENHVGVIAATRLGKTTSYVVPTILSFARQKTKKSMIISDPKGEVYKNTANALREQGYDVRLFNFRDFMHSEYWNPLTKIYRAFHEAYAVDSTVKSIDTPQGRIHEYNSVTYDSISKLKETIQTVHKLELAKVDYLIDNVVCSVISVTKKDDPYWEETAREVLKACIWGLLEDSLESNTTRTRVSEETFSFSTILTITDSMGDDGDGFDDHGFFTSRPPTSRALSYAKLSLLHNAPNTRKCVLSTFNTCLRLYKESTVRIITSCNSFELSELADETKPIAVFIDYRDENKDHYKIISSFVQSAYTYLIEYANAKPHGKLDAPFYFILDEFGNFPEIKDFETVISACAGRNIFFILILQSYAQLNNVYGENVAAIIRDNLNMHVFMGSNNPETLEAFSKECGETTKIAPFSALNGNGEKIDTYHIETIPLVPKSALSNLGEGECIITEANCGYVMFTELIRFFKCDRFEAIRAQQDDYVSKINPLDNKYFFKPKRIKPQRRFDF